MNSRILMVGLVSLVAASSSAEAVVIGPGAFGGGAGFESFEGLSPGPNLTRPDSSNGYLVPGVNSPFTFGSGATLTGPVPNPGLQGGAIVGDFSIADANFSLLTNGTVLSAADVPFGSAYMGINAAPGPPVEFSFTTPMLRVGAYVTGSPGLITVTTFDSGGAVLESTTTPSVDVSLWGSNFIGLQNTAGIAKVRFSGSFAVLDGLTFEPVPVPAAAVLAMIGLGISHRLRRRIRRN